MGTTLMTPASRVHREQPDQFGIEIRFKPYAPSRVFRAMSALIESCEYADQVLAQSINSRIHPILLLEDVEAGSIRAWLKNTLQSVDDDALRSGDYKKIIGAYLVRGKKSLIDFCNRRTTIASRREIEELQGEILNAASETNVLRIPTYQPPPPASLVETIQMISDSTGLLSEGDSAQYLTVFGDSEFNLSFRVSLEAIEELLVKESMTHDAPMIMRIKKAGFPG